MESAAVSEAGKTCIIVGGVKKHDIVMSARTRPDLQRASVARWRNPAKSRQTARML